MNELSYEAFFLASKYGSREIKCYCSVLSDIIARGGRRCIYVLYSRTNSAFFLLLFLSVPGVGVGVWPKRQVHALPYLTYLVLCSR